MGNKVSFGYCCAAEQQSINLSTSADASLRHLQDDEALVHSNKFDSSLSLCCEKIEVKLRPYTLPLLLDNYLSREWPCIISLTPPELESRQGVDIVYILELTSQVPPVWMNYMKKCILYALSKLNRHDRVSIVGYNEVAFKLCPLTLASKENTGKIYNCVRNIEGTGTGNIHDGITMGLNILNNRRMHNTVSAVILFAKPEGSIEKVRSMIRGSDFSTNSIYFYLFGLGEHSSEFLNMICSETNGTYYNIPHPLAFPSAFGSCMGEILGIYAENFRVNLELVPSAVPLSLERVYICQSHIISGKTTEVCALLIVMPCTSRSLDGASVTILKVGVKYKVLGSGAEIREEYFLQVPVFGYDKICKDIEIDAEAMLHVWRLKLADMLYEALFENNVCASELMGKFLTEMNVRCEDNWVIQIKEEVKNYENLLKHGWNSAVKARIMCSVQGYFNKSLFYVHDFQTLLQSQMQRDCKEAVEARSKTYVQA